ncbi:MAG TPA: hypothetical protein VI756_12150 [Blastocatellia bacterium]
MHNPLFELRGVTKRCTPEERFSRFGRSLEPGVLYVFGYNQADRVKELTTFDQLGAAPPVADEGQQ